MTNTRATAFIHPAFARTAQQAARHEHAHPHHIPGRIYLESLVLTIVTVMVFAGILTMQNGSLLASDQRVISYGINASNEPMQKSASPFETTVRFGDAVATFTSDTSYSISARVESRQAYHDTISPAIPEDLLLSWGQLADTGNDSKLHWEQSERRGTVSGTLGNGGVDLTSSYVISHVSNNHLVPASDTIRKAMATIQPGDLVRIDGRLVNVRMAIDNRVLSVTTSKSRTDQGDGACEIIYVEHLRVNDRSY